MPDDTHTLPLSTEQESVARRCDYHKGPSETAVLVDAIERNSAPPIPVYACAPCREQRRLVPLGEDVKS